MREQVRCLVCPKCRGNLRTSRRNGVQIDQCETCRGMFLDRGELERLISAESSYFGARPTPSAPMSSSVPPLRTDPGGAA